MWVVAVYSACTAKSMRTRPFCAPLYFSNSSMDSGMRKQSSTRSLGSKLCTTRQTFIFMPMRSLDAMAVWASMYMSEKEVTPEAISSIMASSLPAAMSSAVMRFSTGIILSNSHSCSGRSLPTPRSRVMPL